MTAPDPGALLDALDEAHAKATAAPWGNHPTDPAYIIGAVGEGEDGPEWLDVGDTGGRPPGYPGSAEADAAAIVAAHNALPALTAAIRAALALSDELLEETTESARLARAYKQADKWPGAASAEAKAWTSGDAAARLRATVTAALTGGQA